MVRVRCPGCHSQLNAKDELAGQVRKCPKCQTPIRIPTADPEGVESISLVDTPDESVPLQALEPLPTIPIPRQLVKPHRYLICDNTKLMALWQPNGKGWMLKINTGMIPALRNINQAPVDGNFQFVEIRLESHDDGLRLDAIVAYQLAQRYALYELDKGDHQILSMITGPGQLNREQKNVIRQTIRDLFLPEVWADAQEVLDYLSNTDYHSPGTVQFD